MDRYRLLSIIIVPRVTHTMGIMSGGFILVVVMAVTAISVAYSIDDRSGGKRQTEKQVEVVMA
jgi:hypothetical protein